MPKPKFILIMFIFDCMSIITMLVFKVPLKHVWLPRADKMSLMLYGSFYVFIVRLCTVLDSDQ